MIHLILFLISAVVTQHDVVLSTNDRSITGKVMTDTKELVLFCNVIAYDEENKPLTGVITDLDGKFTLTISTSCKWLEATYVGLETTRVEVTEANDYVITMKTGAILSEAVVVAISIPREKKCMGMAAESDRIRNLPTKNISKIAATTAGLSSVDGSEISIRGARVGATGYYIDGIPADTYEDTYVKPLTGNLAEPEKSLASDNEITSVYEAGQLTAGEINDFGKWKLWNDKSQQELREYRSIWNIYPSVRFSVFVQNMEGFPLVGQPVYLLDDEQNIVWSAKTDNTGKAELWANMFEEKSNAGNKFSISTVMNDHEYVIRHAKQFGKGMNHLTVESKCSISNVVDAVFVVDATGSMGDEIQYLQNELTDVMQKVKDKNQDLVVNLGCVFYRDHGDAYVTRTSELSDDISKTTGFIKNQTADGGGDQPEALDEALEVAVRKINWSPNARTKLIFVVMDASPHQSAENLQRIKDIIYEAARQGIKVIPLTASGIDKSTEYLMRSLALCTNGTYVFLTDHSGIGNPHIEPTTDTYDVEKLNDLLIRLFEQNISVVHCSTGLQQKILVMSDTVEIDTTSLVSTDTIRDLLRRDMRDDKKKETFHCKYYPNPTTGLVNFDVYDDIRELFLCDVSGKLLQKFQVKGSDKLQLDISKYPIGTYRLMYFENPDLPRSGLIVLAR